MRAARCGALAMLLLLPGGAALGLAQDQTTVGNDWEPQIVRVSYVQGDVRVSRGKDVEKQSRSVWEKAAVDLPIETGYSLVTGEGRAEIEFEDASVAYLGENSVLVFNDLHTTGGIPQTELALLSGTMSLDAEPVAAGEWFRVRTPTDEISVRYPKKVFLRVNSYLDAMGLTPVGNLGIEVDQKSTSEARVGPTLLYRKGQLIDADKSIDQTAFADFDQWVLHEATTRKAAMAETMQQAGLRAPIPGLAQLKGQGHFYACPPYGTCWEPTNGFAGNVTDAEKAATARQTVSVAALVKGGRNQNLPAGTSGQSGQMLQPADIFPCSPLRWNQPYGYDPVTGRRVLANGQLLQASFPLGGFNSYDWAVCHSGSWIRNRGKYVWVTGVKHHPHCPVHWVKDGHRVGYVPIHPKDVAGKPPVGLKDGIMYPVDKHGDKVELVAANSEGQVKLLHEPPRELRSERIAPLQRAENPQIQAYSLKDVTAGVAPHGTEVKFNQRTEVYMVAKQGPSGNSQKMEPIGGRGNSLQAHEGWSPAVTGQSTSSNNSNGNSSSNSSFNNSSASSGGSSFSGTPATSAPAAPSGGGGGRR